jgi:ABC-type cobalt transport system substrate-binding protein
MTIMRKRRVMILPEGEYRKVKSRVWVVTLIEAVKFIAKDMKSEGLDKEAEDMVNAAFESFVPFFRHIEEDTSGDADITNEAPASVQ